MARRVHPAKLSLSVAWIKRSVSPSIWDVASSSRSTFGIRISALARHTSCLCPTLQNIWQDDRHTSQRVTLVAKTTIFHPTLHSSSSVWLPVRSRLSRRLPRTRLGSCITVTAFLSLLSGTALMSTPSIRMLPRELFRTRRSASTREDLPAPVLPTTPTL
ncbi:unnamed protein product, partial [Ixodes persulcatus]